MMKKSVISVRNLGKRYLLGKGGGERYRALRDVIANSVKSVFKRNDRQNSLEELWALKDVCFDVEDGETVGIIGRNGAGKSTLLKLLSEITEPTEGEIHLRGKVSSLLEVGVGFHPELTGRENILMNGAILGMTRNEIKRKFDEIVAFAEIEKFLDTPAKRYSSGMYIRLAFAVAAHLEPDVLLIDEVLAVGDVNFQKKCLGKMEDISQEGRTVLLVSHNMSSINNLCNRVILLDEGVIVADGQAANVVQQYISLGGATNGEIVWPDIEAAPGNNLVRLHAVRILQDDSKSPTGDVDISKEIVIQIEYRAIQKGVPFYTAIWLRDKVGVDVLSSGNATYVSLTKDPWYGQLHPRGLFKSVCRIPANFLNEGRYSITAIVGKLPNDTLILEKDVISFDVCDTGEMRKEYYGGWLGVVRPKLAWKTEKVSV